MASVWNKAEDNDLSGEITASSLRMMTEDQQQSILFKAIRASDLHVIRSVLQVNRTLLNAKMFGYDGTDVFEVVKNSKSKRCYSYTGQEKDGFFYPLHVAAEMGHKNLTILLAKAGADVHALDYRGRTAEENCNGNAQHAFYELRGFKFDARERYQGKTDRQGLRTGQGILFYKPEGYMQEEKQLYRGSFKQNLYHGHGTLYYPGSDVIAYIGRFKEGMKHGRGIEFDSLGHKVYQGTFRDDKREGRGEEFAPVYSELSTSNGSNASNVANHSSNTNNRIYKGEFMNNMRHGFGVAYYSEGSKYYGRYEHNLMSGVGIYVHPDGNRFEGMFYNNKADGLGSFYERDAFTGNFTNAQHAIWQAGKKVKEANTPFVPTLADLPDDTTKNLFNDIMNNHHNVTSFGGSSNKSNRYLGYSESEEDHVLYNYQSHTNENEAGVDENGMPVKKKREKLDFTYFDREEVMQTLNKTDWWKVQLGKYMKLSIQEAPVIGLSVPAAILNLAKYSKSDEHNGEDKYNGDDDNMNKDFPRTNANSNDSDSDEDVDEVIGYHFMECTTLFTSYVYVTSANKVFEDRLVHQGLTAEFPDFEAVYHLVIDAVDNYNDQWEIAYRIQQQQQQLLAVNPPNSQFAATSSQNLGFAGDGGGMDLESRRLMFMTEKEKKAEQIIKQRAELAVKKGTAELNSKVEKTIASEILATLEEELTKLLRIDNNGDDLLEEKVHMNLPIAARKTMNTESTCSNKSNNNSSSNNNNNNNNNNAKISDSSTTNQTPNKTNSSNNPNNNTNNNSHNTNSTKKSPGLNNAGPPNSGAKKKENGLKLVGGDSSVVNLEDLFDIDNFSTTMASTNNDDANTSNGQNHNNGVSNNNTANNGEGDGNVGGNEFAAELLYIMRMSMALT